MSALLSSLFLLAVAFNTYYAAKRSGRWSWPRFFVVVAALIVVPIAIMLPLMHMPWLLDKPALFTLIATGLIILFVCVLAYVLKKCRPPPDKPAP